MNKFKSAILFFLLLLPSIAMANPVGYRIALLEATLNNQPVVLYFNNQYETRYCLIDKYRFKDGNTGRGEVEHIDCANQPGTLEYVQNSLMAVDVGGVRYFRSEMPRYQEIAGWANYQGLNMTVFSRVMQSLDQNLKFKFRDNYGNVRSADPISLDVQRDGQLLMKYEPVPKQGSFRPTIDIRNVVEIGPFYP